jgi:hypothetical protein
VSADGKSLFKGLWDTFSSAVFNAYDAYGWILPALLLTILLLGVLVLIACAMEDLRSTWKYSTASEAVEL